MRKEVPNMHHFYCAKHILGNMLNPRIRDLDMYKFYFFNYILMQIFRDKFWKLVQTPSASQVHSIFEDILQSNPLMGGF
jgi:hypothetical protein